MACAVCLCVRAVGWLVALLPATNEKRQLAKGKVVESEVVLAYPTLLHATGPGAPCMPPQAGVDDEEYVAAVAKCSDMLLNPEVVPKGED